MPLLHNQSNKDSNLLHERGAFLRKHTWTSLLTASQAPRYPFRLPLGSPTTLVLASVSPASALCFRLKWLRWALGQLLLQEEFEDDGVRACLSECGGGGEMYACARVLPKYIYTFVWVQLYVLVPGMLEARG